MHLIKMKLSNILALTSVFWAGSQATITLEDLPREVRAGSTQLIKFSNDRDYVCGATTG